MDETESLNPYENKPPGVILPEPDEAGSSVSGAGVAVTLFENSDCRPYISDFDAQTNKYIETSSCVPFSVTHCFEIMINAFLQKGMLSQETINYLTEEGIIEEGKAELSERFLANVDGTTTNGTSQAQVWQGVLMGMIAQHFFPFDPNITTDQQWFSGVTQDMIDRAKKFLKYFGFIRRTVKAQNETLNYPALVDAMRYAPCNAFVSWGQGMNNPENIPVPRTDSPICHSVTLTFPDPSFGTHFLDQYKPFIKTFALDYNMAWIFQTILIPLQGVTKGERMIIYKFDDNPTEYVLSGDTLIPFTDLDTLNQFTTGRDTKTVVLPAAQRDNYFVSSVFIKH